MAKKNEYFIKSIIILLSIVPTMVLIKSVEIPVFIIFLFLYFLNIRLRKVYTNEKFLILSLLIDLILIYIIYTKYDGLIYLLIGNTLVDGILYLEKYYVSVGLICGILTAYFIQDKAFEIILLNALILIALLFFTLNIKTMKKRLSDIEYLYDDVRRYSYELEKTQKQVELYSKKVEALTQTEERNRISREIHDTIGHRLTALLFQMEAGVRLLENNPQKGKTLLQASVENLRESIDVLRDTVRSMKPKVHKNMIHDMQEMVSKFKKDTGVYITFDIQGNPVKLYPGAELVFYKNAQEALTNAIRHGKAKKIQMNLSFKDREVVLVVKNDGNISGDIKKGMGITGMEERLNFIGGRLNIYCDSDFVVETIIPIRNTSV